ncbi:hypothetical protein MJ560_17590 [Klebsiella pneumoniae]|nr:hypothetical protein MJ560_17590 [Klebsiella pneumoniae]
MRGLKMPWVLRKAWRRQRNRLRPCHRTTGNQQTLNDALKELAQPGMVLNAPQEREHQQSTERYGCLRVAPAWGLCRSRIRTSER